MDIVRYRRLRGMTARQMADLIGVSKWTLCRYESGKAYPGPLAMDRLQTVTKGLVTAQDMLDARLAVLRG